MCINHKKKSGDAQITWDDFATISVSSVLPTISMLKKMYLAKQAISVSMLLQLQLAGDQLSSPQPPPSDSGLCMGTYENLKAALLLISSLKWVVRPRGCVWE
jgi:hypothetical protein